MKDHAEIGAGRGLFLEYGRKKTLTRMSRARSAVGRWSLGVIPFLGAIAVFSLRLSALPVEIAALVPSALAAGTTVRATVSPIAQNNVNQGGPALPIIPRGQPGNELEIPPVAPGTQLNHPPISQPFPETGSIPFNENQSTREIPLPKVFQGCWQGQVTHPDSLRSLSGRPPGLWITKTYRLCYRRVAQGPFVLTLATAGVDSSSIPFNVVSSVRSALRVLGTDGRRSATLRAFLHFNQPDLELGVLAGTAAVDELTEMTGRLDGDVMHVQAKVYAEWNRSPWCVITWHADFVHAPN
jgi:hypothetical protein